MSAATIAVSSIVAVSAILAAPSIITEETERAQLSNALTDLANLATAQQLSIAIDGLYAPSLDALLDSAAYDVDGMSIQVDLRSDGTEVFYIPTADRSEYLLGSLLPNGAGVIVSSSENTHAVQCESYSAECAALVTTSVELINTVPRWVTIAPR